MAEVPQIRKVATERIVSKIAERTLDKKFSSSSPIGIFDSGVGGLTVLKEVMSRLPGEDIIYLADTARVPYGGRPAKELIKINLEIFDYFSSLGVKMIIIACGTSSAVAYPAIKDKYNIPLVEMIGPGSREAVSSSRNGKIGVIATSASVASGAWQGAIKETRAEAEVLAEECPLFVPLIEGGFIEKEETEKVAREYLRPLLNSGIDTLVLGCTHYPHLETVIKKIAGSGVVLVDPAKAVAAKAAEDLKKSGLLKGAGKKASYTYEVTGPPLQFKEVGSRLLGKQILAVRQIILPSSRGPGGI